MTHDHRTMANGEPYAEITQVGRWMRRIEIHHQGMVFTPADYALGQRRAERHARWLLARYVRRLQREANTTRIAADEPSRATPTPRS